MNNLPSGTVTFLFTDIEGSTSLWEKHPEAMKAALAKHDSLLRSIFLMHNGQIVKITGDGFHVVFTTATDAAQAAIHAQQALQKDGSGVAAIKVRMGIHTGEAELRDGDYFGQTLNLAARVTSIGHGGQILLSETTMQVSREHLAGNVSALDLGLHYLKGFDTAEKVFQISTPDLQQDFPALNSLAYATNNLPLALTSFIGRERELTEAQAKLSSAKLLTLIGPGGTGKTRLSIQIAAEQLGNFKDGVWLVELASISDPAFITSTIASVFDIREVQNIPLLQLVIDYLRSKEILLILDNCEHLVEASAQVTNQLLHECPNLKIIASSREALGVDGETVYRVPSLSLPPAQGGVLREASLRDAAGDGGWSKLLDYEATRLFVERAKKAEPRFHLTEDNAAFIAQICSRLDGIPLAIELAAARVKVFTPEQIAARLDDRFKLLTGGSRTALPRQQTLRALIDWSYTSLTEVEQRALRRLAVFSGGWTFEAAESIVGGDEALDGLPGLVNKSLVNVEEQAHESRYRFLETIRQYAMEKLLESGEAVDARDRHLDYMLEIAGETERRMFGSETQEWLDQMEVEHDNLRTAFEWGSANHPAKALKLAFSLGGFWTVRDHISEARAWCQTILEKTESRADLDLDRARAYGVLGWMSVTSGEHKAGRLAAEKAILLGGKTHDTSTVTRAYGILALTSLFLGDFPTAEKAAMEGEALARTQGMKSELAFVLSIRAQMHYFSRTDLAQAKANLEEAARLSNEEGFRWASSFLAIGMAHTAAFMGDLQAARAAFVESGEIAKRMGNRRIFYSSQSELAHVLRTHGDLDEPLGIYRDLLPKWKDLGHRSAVAHELECIAYILTRKEKPERAAVLLGAANSLREVIDSVMTNTEQVEYEKEISSLRGGMDPGEFDTNWIKGRNLTIDEAIKLAVGS